MSLLLSRSFLKAFKPLQSQTRITPLLYSLDLLTGIAKKGLLAQMAGYCDPWRIMSTKVIVMAENMVSGQDDLQNWMKNLPIQLRETPIIYLAIPGSHDSMSYGITRSSTLAPDAEPILHKLYPLFRSTILRWTITQTADVTQQLLMGIRYFDLRLATKTGTNELYFTHGLYADEISQPLQQVRSFLDSHPEEVVILDFQHFYSFTNSDHQNLMVFIMNTFGAKLCPRPLTVKGVTLNAMNVLKQQVIIVYRHSSVFATGEFWPTQMLPTPWPRQDKPGGLIEFFHRLRRNSGAGFVHQAVLTPTPTFIVLRWFSNIRERCAKPVINDVLPKLAEYSPGVPTDVKVTVNVVIADFIEMNNALFPRTIIDLNFKLLRNVEMVYHGMKMLDFA